MAAVMSFNALISKAGGVAPGNGMCVLHILPPANANVHTAFVRGTGNDICVGPRLF